MFNDFDNSGRIKIRKPLITVDQRSMNQFDPLRLSLLQPIKP